MEALAGRHRSQTTRQMLTAPGAHRIVGGGEVETPHPNRACRNPSAWRSGRWERSRRARAVSMARSE